MALTDTDKILGQIYFDPGHVAGFKGKSFSFLFIAILLLVATAR